MHQVCHCNTLGATLGGTGGDGLNAAGQRPAGTLITRGQLGAAGQCSVVAALLGMRYATLGAPLRTGAVCKKAAAGTRRPWMLQ